MMSPHFALGTVTEFFLYERLDVNWVEVIYWEELSYHCLK